MSFFEFLRKAFQLPPRQFPEDDGFSHRPPDPFWGHQDVDEDDEFFGRESRRGPWRPHGFENFSMFSGDIMEMHKYFEQQMEDMIRSFTAIGSFDFDSGGFDNNPFGGNMLPSPPDQSPPALPAHPQERYLKPHFENNPSVKADTDLDSQLQQGGLDSMLPRDQVKKPLAPRSHFSSQSHSTQITMGPDGRVERQETVKTPDGGTRTTITRRIGDKEHSFTTNTSPEGLVSTDESFINMDENSVHSFDKLWNDRPRSPSSHPQNPDNSLVPDYFNHDRLPSSGLFDSFFKFFK